MSKWATIDMVQNEEFKKFKLQWAEPRAKHSWQHPYGISCRRMVVWTMPFAL
jgi:hypothetical protein